VYSDNMFCNKVCRRNKSILSVGGASAKAKFLSDVSEHQTITARCPHLGEMVDKVNTTGGEKGGRSFLPQRFLKRVRLKHLREGSTFGGKEMRKRTELCDHRWLR